MYGVGVDKSQISGITDRIIPVIKEWQGRPLEAAYPIVCHAPRKTTHKS
ncbi:MAG: transposase [Pseudomonadota bacterium]